MFSGGKSSLPVAANTAAQAGAASVASVRPSLVSIYDKIVELIALSDTHSPALIRGHAERLLRHAQYTAPHSEVLDVIKKLYSGLERFPSDRAFVARNPEVREYIWRLLQVAEKRGMTSQESWCSYKIRDMLWKLSGGQDYGVFRNTDIAGKAASSTSDSLGSVRARFAPTAGTAQKALRGAASTPAVVSSAAVRAGWLARSWRGLLTLFKGSGGNPLGFTEILSDHFMRRPAGLVTTQSGTRLQLDCRDGQGNKAACPEKIDINTPGII